MRLLGLLIPQFGGDSLPHSIAKSKPLGVDLTYVDGIIQGNSYEEMLLGVILEIV